MHFNVLLISGLFSYQKWFGQFSPVVLLILREGFANHFSRTFHAQFISIQYYLLITPALISPPISQLLFSFMLSSLLVSIFSFLLCFFGKREMKGKTSSMDVIL